MAAADHLHPGQLKMFMSAREILTNYDPHEGDRQYQGTRQHVGQGIQPSRFSDKGDYEWVPPETNDEMWDRKLKESKQQMRGGLYQKLEAEGVQHPIPLTHFVNPRNPAATKPMVGGGQHRIAAMNAINPDQLMPVAHYENILEAKKDPGYT